MFSAGYDIATISEETFERDAEALVAHPFHGAMEATMPMEATVPNTGVALPVGVICACSPFRILARSALCTAALTP